MFNLLNDIVKSLLNHKKYKSLSINNLSINIYSRNIYENSCVYDEYIMKLVFLVDDGGWFDKTVRFEISILSNNSKIKVRNGYGDDYINFKYKDYKDIAEYLVEKIEESQNKNFKYIKKVI